jgi:hypothetical protein
MARSGDRTGQDSVPAAIMGSPEKKANLNRKGAADAADQQDYG